MEFSEILSRISIAEHLKETINHPLAISVVGGILVAIALGVWSKFTKTGKAFWRFVISKITRSNPKVPSSTIRVVCDPRRQRWHMGSSDGKPAMQLSAHLYITNITNQPIFILRVYLKKPSVEGTIFVRHPKSDVFGNYPILPDATSEATADFWIYPAVKDKGQSFQAKIVLTDQYDNAHKTAKLHFASDYRPSRKKKPNLTPEPIYKIANPVERTVVSVLQDELHRYKKCGRPRGGLGSVTTGEQGQVQSYNAKMLVDYYTQESDQQKKREILDNLLSRLSKDKGYSDVAYLILLVLFRIGHLQAALKKAKSDLQACEPWGFGDFLRLLDILLQREPGGFADDTLDQIEMFIDGLTEHTFQIPNRLVTIRAQLLSRE